MPKVSVIVPVYGVEKYIERCARSLFEQTLDDIEYLFIDDCTPDRSMEILKSVLGEYPNRKSQVIIHRMEQNRGLALVRKWGGVNVTGDYVIHCDSDDWVEADMYRLMYEKAVKEEADVVVCDYVTTDGMDTSRDVVHIGCHNTDRDAFITDMLFQRDSWSLWNKMFKRICYCRGDIRFPEDTMGEDMAITLQLIWYCSNIGYLPKSLYKYYINPSSITHSVEPDKVYSRFRQAINNANIVCDTFEKFGSADKFADGLLRMKYYQKQLLFPLVADKTYRSIWRNTFKEINWKIATWKDIRWQDKVKFYLVLFGMPNLLEMLLWLKCRI